MTVSLRVKGYGLHAEGRGGGRVTRFSGLVLRPGRGDRRPESRHSLPAPASRYAGGMPGADDLPEFAGETFAYAFAGARAGRECRQRLPGLMVAINRCDDAAGRIIPVRLRKTDQEANSNGALIQT